MTNLSEYQQYLLLGKMTGGLTSGESKELDLLLSGNEDVKAAYNDLISKLPAEYVNSSFSHVKDPAFWHELENKYKTRPIFNIWKKLAVAALLAGVIAFASYLYIDHKIGQPVAMVPQRSVELKLADGTKVDLTRQRGSLTVGKLKLQNNDQVLTYQPSTDDMAGINSITVPAGMNYALNLADGSKVWMNSTTMLEFPSHFTGKTREITIAGEAYLQIAKNAARPFIVHLPGSTVEITGTEFNVNTYDQKKQSVSLVEGGLNFEEKKDTIKIKPGQEAVYDQSSVDLHAFDARTVLSWRKGLFYFEEAGIDEICAVIQRWFGVKSIIDNPKLLQMKFAGILDKNKPLDIFLDDLKVISKISAHTDSQGVLHFK